MAAAAYQSGERLFCEYDQKIKHYTNKKEVVFAAILTPTCVPMELCKRNALWNSVEASEKRYDAQLARRVVMALPKEIPREQQILLIQEYCQEQFVSKGMIADIAVHDKGDGNPHAHILLTMRAMDEKGKWLPKARMVYDLDEHGQKQKTAKGNWKCHKEPTVDWNDRKYAETWRREWEGIVNRYYAENGLEERIDLRSYERQKSDKVPTVHIGPAITQMEKRGIRTNVGDLNRDIMAYNYRRRRLRRTILTVTRQLDDLFRLRADAAVALFPYDEPRDLPDILWAYYDIRADERRSWSRYGQRQGTLRDLQRMSEVFSWLQEQEISSVDDFNDRFDQLRKAVVGTTDAINDMEREMRSLEIWHRHLTNRKKYRSVFEQYAGKMFKASKEKYADEHKEELDKYRAAVRYFKAHPERENAEPSTLVEKHKQLKADIAMKNNRLDDLQRQAEPFGQIAYYIGQAYRARPVIEERSAVQAAEWKMDEARTKEKSARPTPPKKRRQSEPSL